MSWEIRSEGSYGKFFLGVKFALCHPLKNLFSETVFFFVGGDITRLNNKSRWLKRSVVIHLKRVKLCLLYPPPYQVQSKNKLKIALAVLAALSCSSSLYASVLDESILGEDLSYSIENTTASFDGISIDITPESHWNYYTISVLNGSTLTINGDTYLSSLTTGPEGADGTYAIHASGTDSTPSSIHLNGDVYVSVRHTVDSNNGADAIYADNPDTQIIIGSEDGTSSTYISAIGPKPDAISAKRGAKVEIKSSQTQLIGSVDFVFKPDVKREDYASGSLGDVLYMLALAREAGYMSSSSISGTFSGSNSFWFGDEYSFANIDRIEGNDRFNDMVDLAAMASQNCLQFTFENGAQWTYFGVSNAFSSGGATVYYLQKRVSNIKLQDGGIINLYDENIRDYWTALGIDEVFNAAMEVNHDYVRIGDLRGSDGIFRLDLNSDNHKASDMIFVESSSEAGMHHIEPYRPQDLTSISEDNRLIFALTAAAANGVTFDETENIYGETLYDYELGISHETIDETKAEQIAEIESMVSNYDTFTDFDIADFYGGTSWFINRLTITQSAASLAMGSAGFAAYDAAIEMDRRDRRLLQTFKDEETGLWVRARHGERGVKNEYGYQLNGFAVGTDYAFSDTNALGIAFSFEKGDTDFKSVVGDGNMKRYELAVYNTHDFGAPYLDFVGRLGIVKSDYTAYNQSRTLSTSGDFDQKYATLSAEAGYTLEETNGVFIEPQVQVQVTYLKDYDYASDRNMHVSADSDYVVLSRVGLRGGRHFDSESLQGEVYGRADVYHQFTDGQDAIFRDTEQAMFQTWGTNKTFASIGLGSYLKAKSGWGVQFDVEKNLGGKSIDSWMITGQARYEF